MYVEGVFWVCLALLAYIYAGYLVGAWLLGQVLRRSVNKLDVSPSITVVISAFNEELEIQQTVINKLSQDYPPDRVEVIVVSDGSTDRTDDIVRGLAGFAEGRVRLLRQEPRKGKTEALNMALRQTSSDIVVFADANSNYAPNVLRLLVRSFADPSVGYVTGRMVYTNPSKPGISDGSRGYMSYENILRSLETRLGSVVGVDGGIDAIRRNLYVPMQADQLPDLVLPLWVMKQGKRVVYEPEAALYEPALAAATEEFRMRVRVSLRALWALYDMRALLNPFRYPLVAWQLISHKLLRYGAFLPLLGLLACNVLLVREHPFYAGFLALQFSLYGLAAIGHFLKNKDFNASKLLMSYYFVLLNVACVVAFWKLLNGKKIVLWAPRQG
jgi:cellulose synthase/poly-beta-1,6-N-acetylglucosamine synthase-like glycosyltransferase